MGKEMEFFIFLIENYAEYKNTTADGVLNDRPNERRKVPGFYERWTI